MRQEDLLQECTRVRNLLEQASKAGIAKNYGHDAFPYGWCGLVCRVLGPWLLIKDPHGKYEYICGMRGEQSHAWIAHNGLIIDITADQFPETNERVIVSSRSLLHDTFKEDFRHESSVEELNYVPENILYRYLVEHWDEACL